MGTVLGWYSEAAGAAGNGRRARKTIGTGQGHSTMHCCHHVIFPMLTVNQVLPGWMGPNTKHEELMLEKLAKSLLIITPADFHGVGQGCLAKQGPYIWSHVRVVLICGSFRLKFNPEVSSTQNQIFNIYPSGHFFSSSRHPIGWHQTVLHKY